ncbi:FAD-binding and (Fe-S)-binding domain-containing protein [Halobaculum magnesiiphilum]|uniref:FAD-binding protein n=1 Tax=Halobaculum magnesiiphilum TaxID=1017351 RepID=A0A8T8WIA2_9EURY|nr:FAD-binding and (Fe-S)-binding domain-containing protein [Halobaculum magnesiiphilum]QZP39568.1 FAD-binding protein [Halobaculum magnesiiphilum]
MSTDDATTVPDGLAVRLDGEVDFGAAARRLYATDASIYEVEPSGVTFPRSREDVREIVAFAREHNLSITARGAGSSLTGNAVGEGIVVDCERHLDDVVAVDPDAQTVTVQPGVVLDNLNEMLEAHDLHFPPDPSTSSTCTIGGMVANDAAGAHSVRHGTTRDNVRRVECVLADGTVADFRHYEGADLEAVLERDDRIGEVHRTVRDIVAEHAAEIDARYPDVERNSSGYDLESTADPDGEWLDLSRLVVGSEGTLGVITEVTLELTERPETRAAALVFYDDVVSAAAAVAGTLEADPSTVELIDDGLLGYARDAWGFDLVPEDAGAALLVEVETTLAAQEGDLDAAVAAARTDATVAVERATDDAMQDRLWKVRKASNPLLNRRMGDEQAPSFIEDAAIPPESLPTYLERVGDVLREHDLEASVFGHAGQGVLHIKPFLNLQEEADREALRAVSERVHDIVLDIGGCVSGEHGDGRLRSQYLPLMYGDELYSAFVEVKRTFDPEDVCNPAKVVPSRDGELASVDEDLRFEGYDPAAVDTALDFGDEDGLDSLVEQCNGCSKCRTTGSGVMCPSYRATGEEITSTRGRANMLRAAIDGELGEDALTSDEFQEAVLDRCLACKACETECPTGVDMAKIKTEAKYQKHEEEGVPLRARLFGNVRVLNRVGSALAPLANRLKEFGPGRVLAEKTLGIDQRRTLPPFAAEPFPEWVASHEPHPAAGERGTVALFPDCYTAYNHPEVGQATVRLLESLGYAVEVPEVDCCGRAALSQGLVEQARGFAETNADILGAYADRGVPVVGVEPSCVSALTEYDNLLDEPNGVPAVSRTVASFLRDRVDAGAIDLADAADTTDATVAFHGHCHATTKGWDVDPVALLRQTGYEVQPVDATCCGMAGAFGYETEHYDLSTTLGAELEAKLDTTDADLVAASGASCSQQLADRDVETHHPMELLAEVVA